RAHDVLGNRIGICSRTEEFSGGSVRTRGAEELNGRPKAGVPPPPERLIRHLVPNAFQRRLDALVLRRVALDERDAEAEVEVGSSHVRVAEPRVKNEEPGHHAADEDGMVSSKPDGPQQMRGLTKQYGGKGRVVIAV